MLPGFDGDDVEYSGDEIRRIATYTLDLVGSKGGLLAVCETETNWVEFTVFEFAGKHSDESFTRYSRVFHGIGPSGSLRELRHTFWGEPDNGGYIFYPDGRLICDAFQKLGRWFDGP